MKTKKKLLAFLGLSLLGLLAIGFTLALVLRQANFSAHIGTYGDIALYEEGTSNAFTGFDFGEYTQPEVHNVSFDISAIGNSNVMQRVWFNTTASDWTLNDTGQYVNDVWIFTLYVNGSIWQGSNIQGMNQTNTWNFQWLAPTNGEGLGYTDRYTVTATLELLSSSVMSPPQSLDWTVNFCALPYPDQPW